MNKNLLQKPVILIIVGITGDLAKRKLIPSIIALKKSGMLPRHFSVVGITRQAGQDKNVLFNDIPDFEVIIEDTHIFSMDVGSENEYRRLRTMLESTEAIFGQPAQRLLYLSVPPTVSSAMIEHLAHSGLTSRSDTRILLEKPFGTDLASAEALIKRINASVSPDQVLRIDHYLAKNMVQEMLGSRIETSEIQEVIITASERIGIEGRVKFYEETGALLDLVQSHLLQFVAITLMDISGHSFPIRRYDALSHLKIVAAVRGQYEGYTKEVAHPLSSIETFVMVKLVSSATPFNNVPITIVTGKSLDVKHTEIRIKYRNNIPDAVFTDRHASPTSAYERVLYAAIIGDTSIFVTNEEVLASWRVIAATQNEWRNNDVGLKIYPPGSTIADVVSSTYGYKGFLAA